MAEYRDFMAMFASLDRGLRLNGIRFTPQGSPVFPESILAGDDPDVMVDWDHRRDRRVVADPSVTAVNFFMPDARIWPRLASLADDLREYRRYMAAVGFDLSPSVGMDRTQQRFNIVLGQMATVWLGLHGVRVVPNWRIGDESTLDALDAYPEGATVCAGTLGCHRGDASMQSRMLERKLDARRPARLLAYGAVAPRHRSMLDEKGVPWRAYPTFRALSFAATEGR